MKIVSSLVAAIAGSCLIGLGASVYAQDPAPGLQNLVGARGRDGEMSLQNQGYEFRWADNSSGEAVYSYWTNYQTGQCISVRTEEGRYASIVTSPAFDCDQGDPAHVEDTGNTVDRRLADLIGVRASSGEAALQERGYSYVSGEEFDSSVATYWIEGSTGDCVEVITSDGVYQEIFEAEWYYCQ
ncbi:hypothetical protein S7335_3036 [Synechococcus sp. PCC 7335]|uniref:hypothetical protein n=1 Tax=Synechococcus sp. (strain ATCC 29403 / PCC 7335) TaxID=91464 RepID=UPI00017EB12F|nr:hypothetical protein [Synechococcus sp. PCC 7335]EDX85337.1 hypothetical protein S7335_3036 [Synechococcus sp. PCC 7335]